MLALKTGQVRDYVIWECSLSILPRGSPELVKSHRTKFWQDSKIFGQRSKYDRSDPVGAPMRCTAGSSMDPKS